MAQSPASIAHEARGTQVALKEILKAGTPWDRDVEFQRKRLRRQLLALLLTHPYEPESKDIENHLWMQTSYTFISDYKQRIAALDKLSEPHPQQTRAKNGSNAGEHGRTVQRFRQFLAEEERFYIQLVARCRRTFGLDEIHSKLVALNIIPADNNGTPPKASNDRNHNQFPPEDSISWLPEDTKQRKGRLGVVSKLLISLGDIARYRELYNESGGRPKAGHEDGPPRGGGKNRRGNIAPSELLAKARNYEKALAYYEQAKSITPDDGHAYHQLGILASYQKDFFGSVVYYHRALCVAHPHEMATDNLGSQLGRSLTHWKAERVNFKLEKLTDPSIPLRIRVNIFEVHVAVLHSLWRLPPARMDSLSPMHARDAAVMFSSLISQRILPIELISKTIVLTQGALWKHRTIRDRSRGKRHEVLSAEDLSAIETRIFSHLLDFHRVLLDEGKSQVEELHSPDSSAEDLAQRITANFRRTLPALRISSKWLRANLKYMLSRKDEIISPFWTSYSAFMRTLAKAFPLHKLPKTKVILEEDVEMRGFAPLGGLMNAHLARDSEAHPNVDQLIRIADLLEDANILARAPNSPVALYGGYVVAKDSGLERAPPSHRSPWTYSAPNNAPQADDDTGLEPEGDDFGTETTSDPGNDAINAVISDDEIVWDPNPSSGPVTPPKTRMPPPSAPIIPGRRDTATNSTTARDLLNNVLGGSTGSVAATPPLLFGSSPPGRAPSIWSTQDQTAWHNRMSPPLNTPASLSQINPPLGRSPPTPSHLRRLSHDYLTNSGTPTMANPANTTRLSPPHVPAVPLGLSHQFSPSHAPQLFSMRATPHTTRYAYNEFVPLHSQLEYGLQHPQRMFNGT